MSIFCPTARMTLPTAAGISNFLIVLVSRFGTALLEPRSLHETARPEQGGPAHQP
jgi:hypothetical protein